ncbi:MAG: hypothetical protein RLZZ536_3043 [Planctomycetota bacterium]
MIELPFCEKQGGFFFASQCSLGVTMEACRNCVMLNAAQCCDIPEVVRVISCHVI